MAPFLRTYLGKKMFHVKLLLISPLLLIGMGCADVSGPEGWADPIEIDDTVVLQL